MEFDLVPDPGADDPVTRAAVVALRGWGILDDPSGFEARGAWHRAGVAEAVERSGAPGPYGAGSPAGGAVGRGSVLPMPSRRGATRA
jgi:hypothetical protein